MSDQITEHVSPSAEHTTINPHPETGIEFTNKEAAAAKQLHSVASEIGGMVSGPETSMSTLGELNHNQFETNSQVNTFDPKVLNPNPQKYKTNDARRWFAEKIFGRRAKNAA